jgi:hypothetical protein
MYWLFSNLYTTKPGRPGMYEIPFRVGQVVYERGEFTDRAEEVKRIRRAIRERERLLVLGERRQGKSSAIRRAVEGEARAGLTTLWIELWTVRNASELLRRIVSSVPLGWSYLERLQLLLAQGGLQPQMVATGPTGEPGLTLGYHDREMEEEPARQMIEKAIGSLDRIAGDQGHAIVLVLDEFQEINRILGNGAGFLRGLMQNTPNLGFVLAGSIHSLISELVGPKGPFHNIDRLEMGPIDALDMARWIRSRMAGAGVTTEAPVARELVALAGPTTEHRVQLARESFVRGMRKGSFGRGDLKEAFHTIVASRSNGFELIWAEMADSHRSLCRAIAAGVSELTGQTARREFDLPTPAAVFKALGILRKKGIASPSDPPRLADPFFAEWIRTRAMPDLRNGV